MALYAFDGTWNKDRPGSSQDTNVLKLTQAYLPQDGVCYLEGVGLRFGVAGRILGGLTGAGGRTRVREALRRLRKNVADGDPVVDVVGFSRGAALALEFASRVAKDPPDGLPPGEQVRFLGLWDTVHSFGIPGNDVNLGWQMSLPDNVAKCFHAMALDERRHTFPLTRLSARVASAGQEGRLFEVWFRGVHSDVGGGNRNEGLSSLALEWLIRRGESCGLRFDASRLQKALSRKDPHAAISVHEFDPIRNAFRVVRWNDQVHASVSPRPDSRKRQHNDPPSGVTVVDDSGAALPSGFGG